MKKIIALVLCMLIVVSLAACGGQATTEESGTNTETETKTTTEETQQPEENNEPAGTEPAFDTSWASNEFEAMIPELPFTGWTVGNETDTIYELELGGLRTANGADTATGFEEDKDALITYINSLPAYGFTVEETGENYSWLVTNDEGNTIEFMCSDGYCWITFNKAN